MSAPCSDIMSTPWSIVESAFDATTAKAYEGLFTLGSARLHVRGSFEEHLADAPQDRTSASGGPPLNVKWGTFVPGIYGTHPALRRQIVNLPFFLDLAPEVQGERLDLEHSRISEYCRALDLRRAVLTRALVWHTRAGATVRLRFERFVSAARPALCVQRLVLSTDRAVTVTVRGGIDARVTSNNHDMFARVALTRPAANGINCVVATNRGDTVSMRTMFVAPAARWQYEQDGRCARLRTALRLRPGVPVVLEKRTAVCTSRDRPASTVARVLAGAARVAFDGLLAEHAAVWERRWNTADVQIEGDPRAQHALRVNLYHLLRAVPRGDDRVAICAKGYAGELYQGLFFWDTEMFMLPFYLYTDPDAARTLTDFRIQALPGARRTAAHYNCAGARYPWTSDDQGDECCGPWVFKDHQVHVTADVVYALAHYARATNKPGYLRGAAARVLLETARYWMQRIDHRSGTATPQLLGVMGPDEFTPMTSNNSYTNRLVAFALTAAAAVGRSAGATPAECRAFARTAAALPMPRTADGLVLQCEEFDGLAEADIQTLWKNHRIMFCWQVPQERIFRSKCMKQADVLLLMTLFPHEFTRKEMLRAWNYYLPHTTHDSSLSFGTHCIIAAWLGLATPAYDFWRRSAELDLDVKKGSAAEGIHIAAAGNTWQAAIFGFAGVATALQADVLTITPHLPRRWRRLAFPLVWHGTPVLVDITHTSVTVTNKGTAALRATICGTRTTIAPAHGERVPRGRGGQGRAGGVLVAPASSANSTSTSPMPNSRATVAR